jgi:hypothetical protein
VDNFFLNLVHSRGCAVNSCESGQCVRAAAFSLLQSY